MAAIYLCNSSVRGYHVYQSVWSVDTFRLAGRIARSGILSESGPAGSGRWPLTELK